MRYLSPEAKEREQLWREVNRATYYLKALPDFHFEHGDGRFIITDDGDSIQYRLDIYGPPVVLKVAVMTYVGRLRDHTLPFQGFFIPSADVTPFLGSLRTKDAAAVLKARVTIERALREGEGR